MKRNNSKRKAIIMTILAIVSLLVVIGSTYYIRNVKESVPTTRFESIINHSLPKPIKAHIANKELKAGEVNENLKRIDDVLVGLDKANLQTSSGANQLRLFLEKPWAEKYLIIAFAVCIFFIFIISIWRTIRRKLYNKWYWIMIPLIVLLAFSDISLHLDDASKNQVDPFFVTICFLSIGVAVIAIVQMLIKLLDEKFSSPIRLVRKEHRQNTLLWAAIAGWSMAYLCFFIGMYSAGTQKSALAAIFRPALSACKMFFLADSPADFTAALRLSGGFMGFYTIVKIFVLAVTASTLIWLILYRWKASLDIRFEQTEGKKLYVFFGITRVARILAKDIQAEEKEPAVIVFVENRKDNANLFNSVSFSSVLGLLRHRGGAYDMAAEVDAHLIISNVMMSSPECSELLSQNDTTSIQLMMKNLGLKHFYRLAKDAKETHCFFMYDDQNININGSFNLRKLLNKTFYASDKKFKIHCWARQGAKTQTLEIPFDNDKTEISVLDSSRLSIQTLLQSPENHPVQFVDIDTSTATVSSDFRAVIVGFGETGQDALRFIYEFGAFLDSHCTDVNSQLSFRSPFHCDVIDKDMETLRPSFLSKTPALTRTDSAYNMHEVYGKWTPNKCDPLISFHTGALNSDAYIQLMEKKLALANYIVLALGNDELNLRALNDLMTLAVKLRNGNLKRMRIFVRCYSNEYSKAMESQAHYYNQMFSDAQAVKTFGSEKSLFSYKYVIDDEIIENAKKYHKAYKDFKDDPNDPTWDERHKKNWNVNWKDRCSVKRQEQQDINNYLHKETKLKLIDKCNPKILANAILFNNEGKDFTYIDGTPVTVKVIYNNLARTEHLRWNASHEMLGYIMNDGTSCNELNKTHNCLVPWDILPKVTSIHNKAEDQKGPKEEKYYVDYQAYDYLVVKTTFETTKRINK